MKGKARVLDAEGAERTRHALKRKYGFIGRISIIGGVLRRGRKGSIGIAITLG